MLALAVEQFFHSKPFCKSKEFLQQGCDEIKTQERLHIYSIPYSIWKQYNQGNPPTQKCDFPYSILTASRQLRNQQQSSSSATVASQSTHLCVLQDLLLPVPCLSLCLPDSVSCAHFSGPSLPSHCSGAKQAGRGWDGWGAALWHSPVPGGSWHPEGWGRAGGQCQMATWGSRGHGESRLAMNKREKGKNTHCMQSQNQVHLAEPQQSNRATPSAQTIILNNICTQAMKQSYPNAVPPVCLTRKETLLLQQNGSVEVPRYCC